MSGWVFPGRDDRCDQGHDSASSDCQSGERFMHLRAVFIATVCTILPAATCGCSDAVGTHESSDHAPAKARVAVGDASPQSNRPVGAGVVVPQTQAVRTSRRSALAEFLWNPPPEKVARYRATYGALVLGIHGSERWSELEARADSVRQPLVWASAIALGGYNTGTITEPDLERMVAGRDKRLRPIMPTAGLTVLVIYRTTDEIGMLTNVASGALTDKDRAGRGAIGALETGDEIRHVRIPLRADDADALWARSIGPPARVSVEGICALPPLDSWDGWSFTMLRSSQPGADVSMMGRNAPDADQHDDSAFSAALRSVLSTAEAIERHGGASEAAEPQ
jgi:hypothetical protein